MIGSVSSFCADGIFSRSFKTGVVGSLHHIDGIRAFIRVSRQKTETRHRSTRTSSSSRAKRSTVDLTSLANMESACPDLRGVKGNLGIISLT